MKLEISFRDLLTEALSKPGTVSEAFRSFHGYSIGNQLLAMRQCVSRGIQPGPIASYNAWKEKGRQVNKGEKAIALCMPVTFKKETDQGDELVISRFVFKNNWFVLSQTSGEEFEPIRVSTWSKESALDRLDVTEEPFSMLNGNCMGYAKLTTRKVAINPLDSNKAMTLFHELAHIVLGHGDMTDGALLANNIKEVEAEGVAYIVGSALEVGGLDSSRGYVQSWARGEEIGEKTAQRIFSAANKILSAGLAA